MKKLFWGAVIPLMLSVGFTACSKYDFNDEIGEDSKEVSTKATTYMSVSFTLPTSNDTRSYDDGQDKDDPDFNNVGKWHGKDKIKSVNVYVFKIIGTRGELEVIHKYAASDLGFTQKSISNKTLVTANKAFKVTPGEKAVYVVVNPTQAAEDLLTVPKKRPNWTGANALLNGPVSPKDFEVFDDFYNSSLMQFSTSATLTEEYTTGDKTRAGEIAKVEDGKDVILMTGDGVDPIIDDNVSATEAVSGYKNRPELSVRRAVARVLVTTAATSFDFKGVNPNNGNIEASAIKVSNLTYVVAQGENKIYFDNYANRFRSPAYDKVPSNDDYWTENFQASYQDVGSHYDYSGLWKNTAGASAKVKGITVPTRTVFNANAADELTNVTNDLNEGLKGEFILPTSHYYNTDRAQSKYRKGNTAYILVRGFLTPKYVVQADGSVVDGATLPANADLYLGANGVFYADQATVRNTAKKGVAGQTAQLYKARKVLYFAWINPDNLATNKVVNSPVIRNNVYHVQIKGITKVGANWNPLVPTLDPHNPNIADPNDPDNPINNNPINPDPRPNNNPYEPTDPPINPQDHLSIKDTWMSVNVDILPWAVHSYEIEF
ncbi:Mfa1 family fimbria major subunit [Ihuprevotella massiliensis]|uniref:Mfa1 family fimbria major subunit n=1 Tax=Ihuprevotella massiliensis TaxID=1852368 RepID=UPI00094F25D7